MLEPGYIAVTVTVILALVAGGLYVIRAEVRKGNDAAETAAVQLVPNHGTSLRDAIDRIEKRGHEDRVTYLARITDIHDDVKAIRNRLDSHIDLHNKGA